MDHLVPQNSMRKKRHLACVCLEKSASYTLKTTEGPHCFLPLILKDDNTRRYFGEHHGFCRKSVTMMTPHLYLWETPLWKSSSKDWNESSHNHICQSYMSICHIPKHILNDCFTHERYNSPSAKIHLSELWWPNVIGMALMIWSLQIEPNFPTAVLIRNSKLEKWSLNTKYQSRLHLFQLQT